jgi:16S rRNA (guanine527-N7)-methyltransferase
MDNTLFFQSLRSGLDSLHLSCDNSILSRYFQYYELLCNWNTRMNLISQRDVDRFVEFHILDSLKILTCNDFSKVSRVLDFGSGAGLPGIPLALALPNCTFILLDSIQKKTLFLESVRSSLSLSNVSVLRSRSEDIPSSYDESFDAVITRATVRLPEYFSSCSRFVSPSGFLVSIKGEHISEELSDLRHMCQNTVFNIHDCIPVVPDTVRTGHVIRIARG